MITFIIPTRNNIPYLKLAYGSIRKFYPTEEIIILDDNSTDDTRGWLHLQQDDDNLKIYHSEGRQVGHTVLYDKGVEMATNEIFTIFHADMVCGPNYVENILQWLHPFGVVAATRIEPPLHPPGKEKITKDFGIYPADFKESEFYDYCKELQEKPENKSMITRGIFAPWAMYKKDFLAIGGHDKLFSPFPYEDSDLFQRMILKHYEINQSRDSFVYHFTCRGHRWTSEVKKDDFFYKLCCAKNTSHFIRKWGSWIENDENCYPVINKKYDVGLVVNNCDINLLGILEPWCNTIYVDLDLNEYIQRVQTGTPFDMTNRIKKLADPKTNQILVTFDAKKLTQDNFKTITNLSKIVTDSGEIGTLEYDIFKFEIKGLDTFEEHLINNDDEYYKNQLISIPPTDPYYTNALFDVYEKVKSNV
jgi:glycosyltransferase involved in cell wall biosynthesis